MTHEGTLDFLDVLGSVFVDSDASNDPDADDHDDELEVEFRKGVVLGAVGMT